LLVFQVDFPNNRPSQENELKVIVQKEKRYEIHLQRDWGDYEQNMPDLYNIANYLELYVLGAFGKGRAQIQLLNQYDSCCFAGIKYRTYEHTMREVMRNLGKGKFDIFLDDSHKDHMISAESLKVMFKNEGL